MKYSRILFEALAYLGIALIGIVDYNIKPQISFSLFYIISILLITWYRGKIWGIVVSIITGLIWLAGDLNSIHTYTYELIPYWNALVRILFFITIAVLLSLLKQSLTKERGMAQTDFLTGVHTVRHFYTSVSNEIIRSKRYKHHFTFLYIDLDNFKSVNDTSGHIEGNRALKLVGVSLREQLRKTDIIGRLGGDEFAVLLPESGTLQANDVISKLHLYLNTAMEEHHWPVTFSIGAITYIETPESVEKMIQDVDSLMYTVKKQGKNNIRHAVFKNNQITVTSTETG